ncbi:hypothetical protein GNI_084400 [Gregarina niphandrodes]|uniref:Uncharacterized protein n=1 Tax=Gregarina niphandrodes TaxID=110365 RepID=A0A023B6B7_GRENI|nr:hypothetical protein GNI_084400 [Gregarina niphandrodes]EZG65032.1 hypothetical protein GNI_084400 [Gregarina niphandrodes]|eukprot:XP_011134108.1 hypothetical protein GNI_084400 [Gregarina niphandrodes]
MAAGDVDVPSERNVEEKDKQFETIEVEASGTATVLDKMTDELDLSAGDLELLREARRRMTRRISTVLQEYGGAFKGFQSRYKSVKTNDLRVTTIEGWFDLEFSILSIPACRSKHFNKFGILYAPYGKKLKYREDMKYLREDRTFDAVRIPRTLDIGQIGAEVLLEMNNQMSYTRYLMLDDPPPPGAVPPDPSPSSEVPAPVHFTIPDVAALFWDANRALGIIQGDIDLFCIRIMKDGRPCMEKIAIDIDTATLWLYPVDVSQAPVIKPLSLKPIKCIIDSTIETQPGMNCPNFMQFIDRLTTDDPVPNPDLCFHITHRERPKHKLDDIVHSNSPEEVRSFSMGFIVPSLLIRNELVFVLKTWAAMHKASKPELMKLLGICS